MKFLTRWWSTESGSTLPDLHGGLRLPRNKPGLPLDRHITTLPLPEQLILPLLNYRREALRPLVRAGQTIQKGQLLADGLIASASGCISAIEPRPIIHPSGRQELCIIVSPTADTSHSAALYPSQSVLSLERLMQCGVHGLGGAGFDTCEKFSAARAAERPLHTLLVNAVECEPLVSCDEALMMCEAPAIVDAICALVTMTRCRRCVLAIENDKPAAIAALQDALAHCTAAIELQLLTPIYPSGAERSLVQRVTGHRMTASEHPAEYGIVCINVATALAAWKAQLGFPLTSRIITLAGEACKAPVNVRVVFGTTVADVLRLSGNMPIKGTTRVRVGGPLSGFDLSSLDAPVTATTNCIGLHTVQEAASRQPCIRCGACSDVCPEHLLPQQLYWYARADNLDGARRFGIVDCIECGCCDVVCPSAIPLTATFRHARHTHSEQLRQNARAAAAEQRYQAREERLEKRASTREARRLEAKAKLNASSDPIADALARVRQRRRSHNKKGESSPDNASPDGSS